jgi:hypothetical protein
MKVEGNEELIVSLIKDDLINSKLVNALNDIGLNASNYHLYLGKTVFKLMGFKDDAYSDEVFQIYFKLSKRVRHIDITKSRGSLDNLALHIYRALLEKIPVV